jgi:hypothetical protein
MLILYSGSKRLLVLITFWLLLAETTHAQTDVDAIMIPKNYFCVGAMYSHSSWKDYWEGDFKRDNGNIGRLTTNMYGVMGNYGVANNLNLLFGLPYVTTRASAGTLHGMKGVQDLSLTAKWKAFKKNWAGGTFSLFALGGVSLPVTNYVADFLPMSIGVHSKTAWLRGMIDYQAGHFFATASAVYVKRSMINIDRTSYYTTEMHYTNKVEMPDTDGFNIRAGYRSRQWIAEGIFDRFNTLGGFDIRKNDMPFPSNRMNASRAGINLKYTFRSIKGLELTGGASHVISGRNVGQSTMINGGAFYIMNLSRSRKSTGNN